MAIPTSGQLSILKMAREAKHADYNGSQSMGVISLYDLVNGGQTKGSTVSYPTVNTGCTPNPVTRTSHTLAAVRLFTSGVGYGSPVNYYFNSNIGDATDLEVGDYMFTNTSLTTKMPAGFYSQSNQVNNNDEYFCYLSSACGDTSITIDSTGKITFLACEFCP
jgi:hypothetical protein